jgi:hypothetical protein
MDNPFENITSQLTAAREGTGLFGRPDYYPDVFAIQNSLDAALAQKQIEQEAQRILEDPVLLEEFLKQTGGGDSPVVPSGENKGARSPLSIGIGTETDKIKQDAVFSGLLGLITGGLPGALQGGVKSYITDTLAVLDQVNNSRDSITDLNALQGWTNTRLPAPVVSGKTNYNIPYDSSNDRRVNPAPIVSGRTNYNTPYSGSTSSGGHDAGITGGNSFSASDGMGYNE